MTPPEDQHLAWFLFKMAFQAFFSILLIALGALLDEEKAAEELNNLIKEIRNDPEI